MTQETHLPSLPQSPHNPLPAAPQDRKLQELFLAAKEAMKNAYSPYSGFRVGAAVRLSDGAIFAGCNIENASYGASNCAERVAIQNASSQRGQIVIEDVVVITDAPVPWPPCGLCRQVIAEFGLNARIHLANLSGIDQSLDFQELFPQSFNPQFLKKTQP